VLPEQGGGLSPPQLPVAVYVLPVTNGQETALEADELGLGIMPP
jgi:hypothetical protein